MQPPVDPWESPNRPPADAPPPWRASARVPPAPLHEPTSEFPTVAPQGWPPRRPGRSRRRPQPDRRSDGSAAGRPSTTRRLPPTDRTPATPPRTPMPVVSWQRASPASRRTLFDGWGFTAAGLLVAFCGWGVWAVAGGGGGVNPVIGLVVMLLVAAGLFTLLRLASRIVFGQLLHRTRPHARWSHFLTGLFLAAAGVSYLANTRWLVLGALPDVGQHWLYG